MTTEEKPPNVEFIRVGDDQGRGGLYNTLVPGGFDRAAVLLPVVGINPDAGHLFRLRDAWVEKDGTGRLFVHVYTRVGGGNRDDYAAVITKLRSLPDYVRDADDSFDATYASFWFRVSEQFTADLAEYASDPVDTGRRWQKILAVFGGAS